MKIRIRAWCIVSLLIQCVGFPLSSKATSTDEVLEMIIRMCGDGEVHGEKLEIQATGTGKARVVKLLRLLGDGSVAGEIVVAKSQVAGLHDDAHRANESKEQRECRMRYLDQVFDRLVDIKLSQGSAAATITDTIQNPEPIVLGRSRLGNGVLAR